MTALFGWGWIVERPGTVQTFEECPGDRAGVAVTQGRGGEGGVDCVTRAQARHFRHNRNFCLFQNGRKNRIASPDQKTDPTSPLLPSATGSHRQRSSASRNPPRLFRSAASTPSSPPTPRTTPPAIKSISHSLTSATNLSTTPTGRQFPHHLWPWRVALLFPTSRRRRHAQSHKRHGGTEAHVTRLRVWSLRGR